MAITVNWGTKVINVPKADMTLVTLSPYEVRSLDINVFRLALKDLEDDPDGIVYLRTHNHNTEVTVGGTTLARVIEIINGYTVTFEDGSYAVELTGANSNIADVLNLNQVSVRSSNSAGLTNAGESLNTWSESEKDLLLSDTTSIKDKTDNLPDNPASEDMIVAMT